MIKTVIRIANDMVMVFDENGEELPEYQGIYDHVRNKVVADAAEASVFKHWFGHSQKPQVVQPECW